MTHTPIALTHASPKRIPFGGPVSRVALAFGDRRPRIVLARTRDCTAVARIAPARAAPVYAHAGRAVASQLHVQR